ncbi:hypothetical protein MKX07_008887 [Trichoderma sp. CBMAI-0711]|uniref:Uncharacterized protein n=1 Tax=Trichoderma parareesei TaxID=858221 RepID=A0A2H2ZM84_TRIPA|nr:hypothetical protein MKX07_008887 [Trichoderma sp. CBMAI-0711]OTA08437.1 hypothetical protein A9Z42_0001180 [Trichoderma parareesei]
MAFSMLSQGSFVAKLRGLVDDMTSSPRSPSKSPSSSPETDSDKVVETPEMTPPTTQRPRKLKSPPSQPQPRPPLPPRPPRIRRPRKGSLRDILRQHAGTALFMRPICWTDLHASLLGARFCELPPCDTPQPCDLPGPTPSQGHIQPSDTITRLSEALTEILTPLSQVAKPTSTAVKVILSTLWPAAFAKSHTAPELNMYYGDKVYFDAVRAQALWNFPPNPPTLSSQSSTATIIARPCESHGSLASTTTAHSPANLPMLCYIGKQQLATIRQHLFRVGTGPDAKPNMPVLRLQRLRAKQLIPTDSDEDAHFVGIFLAMAQRHFYTTPVKIPREGYWPPREGRWSPREGKPLRPNFQDVKLRILTHDNETCEFLVYTGYVTAKFLDRFYDPSCAPLDEDGNVEGMKIEFTRVPIWPILGLRERLGKALGEDIVGPFDPSKMETWEFDGPRPEPRSQDSDATVATVVTSKRKRGSSPSTSGESSEEESDDDDSDLPDKRRCLSEESRVGVVV